MSTRVMVTLLQWSRLDGLGYDHLSLARRHGDLFETFVNILISHPVEISVSRRHLGEVVVVPEFWSRVVVAWSLHSHFYQ